MRRVAAAGDRIEIVPGIEFSAEYEGASLHVLAYWVDPANAALRTELRGSPTPGSAVAS